MKSKIIIKPDGTMETDDPRLAVRISREMQGFRGQHMRSAGSLFEGHNGKPPGTEGLDLIIKALKALQAKDKPTTLKDLAHDLGLSGGGRSLSAAFGTLKDRAKGLGMSKADLVATEKGPKGRLTVKAGPKLKEAIKSMEEGP